MRRALGFAALHALSRGHASETAGRTQLQDDKRSQQDYEHSPHIKNRSSVADVGQLVNCGY